MRPRSKQLVTACALATMGVSPTFYAARSDAASPPDAIVDGGRTHVRSGTVHALQQMAQTASALPGGASSLNETYRDWQVGCTQQGAAKRCVLSQSQAQQNGQRVLAIELNAPTGGAVAGLMVLPFGLALDAGVTFQLDDKPWGQPLRYRTCLSGGCIVVLSFDASMINALRSGTALKVNTVADGGKTTPFTVSLQGFATALDRVASLSR